MTIEEIRELIKVVNETGVAELELQRGENRVRIVRTPAGSLQHVVVPAVTAPVAAPPPPLEHSSSGAAAAVAGEREWQYQRLLALRTSVQ